MRIVAHPDLTGYAPKAESWHAIDEDSYDGAEDSTNRGMIGIGSTREEAIADLMRLFEEADDEAREDDERRRYFDQHDRSEP